MGLGIEYVGLKFLGDGLNVPTTWTSTAAGMGLGLATGLELLGIDAGIIVGFHLNEQGPATAVISALTIVGFSVATSLFISMDPFRLAHPATRTGSSSSPLVGAPLLNLAF
jgi:hypothetical protein